MKKLNILLYGALFLISSVMLGCLIAVGIGTQLPERASLVSTKSFQVSPYMVWSALLDIESYALWKPHVRRIEMLGENQKGLTKWREFYTFGSSKTFEISEFIPNQLMEVHLIEHPDGQDAFWSYQLSEYEENGVLEVSYYSVVKHGFSRFVHRYIDSKYSETDYFLIRLNNYLRQLSDDQEEFSQILDGNNDNEFIDEDALFNASSSINLDE